MSLAGRFRRAEYYTSFMKEYPKRFYRRPSQMVRDLRAVAHARRRLRAMPEAEQIEPAFRERLMLAVTEVNGCRYCAWAHARMALAAGLSGADVDELAGGSLEGCPPEEIPALLYAQHWAETDAEPDQLARLRVVETYGESRIEAMELVLRTIRIGNLLGNSFDYLLFLASFGRWGGGEKG